MIKLFQENCFFFFFKPARRGISPPCKHEWYDISYVSGRWSLQRALNPQPATLKQDLQETLQKDPSYEDLSEA